MNYNQINSHERDARLIFEPASHTYSYNGIPLRSVTTIVEDCFPKFDKDALALRVAEREGVPVSTILDRWEAEGARARNLGTLLHDKIERYYLGEEIEEPHDDAFPLFLGFAKEEHLHPYRTEWRIYHEDLGIAGTLDFLERTPDGTFNIYDWKRSHKVVGPDARPIIADRFGKSALPPLEPIPDTSYWHYALQLSIYRMILAEKYDIRVKGMYLGIFHPSYPSAWKVEVPYLATNIQRLFNL
ncbi:MAG: hypothetical protein K2K55_04975 [Duncaniella sp.]|nr:hypothetical protein [Duncaniella sp.]